MARPLPESYPDYYQNYVELVPAEHPTEALAWQADSIENFFKNIPESKSDYAYQPGKWTLKELLQHVIDTERIFAYRALCIARKEKQTLPGFSETEYATASNSTHRSWPQLVNEMIALRRSTQYLIESFTDEMLNQSGISNGKPITVNAICFIIIGHVAHHINIVKERYLAE